MELDLHVHTSRYSGCSNLDPIQAVQRAQKVGLDGIALTEHGIRWPDELLEDLRVQSGCPEVVLIPGQEVSCYSTSGRSQGEFLVFGYPKSLGSSRSVEAVLELVHETGGIVVAAHPYRKSRTGLRVHGVIEAVLELGVDAIESEHPSYDDKAREQARFAMAARGVPGIGASDAHEATAVGLCRTLFQRPVTDENSLCEEIRAGRLRAVNLCTSI